MRTGHPTLPEVPGGPPGTLTAVTVDPPRTPRRGAWLPVALTMFAIGWGANQFVSLLVAYREASGLSVATVDALVGAYALGLIPALLVLGPISDLTLIRVA